MRSNCSDAIGSHVLNHLGSKSDRTGSIHHIINQYNVIAFDITDNLHGRNHIGSCPELIAEHQWTLQILGICIGTLASTHVGSGNAEIGEIQ